MSTKQYILIQRELFIKHNIVDIAYNDLERFNVICKHIKEIEGCSGSVEAFKLAVSEYLEGIL